MPITRTPMVDDDGSGTTGTIINNAWKQEFYGQIDSFADGVWVDIAFNAANYTVVTGSGTWTITAGNQNTFARAILNQHTVLVAFYLSGMSTTGSITAFGITIPGIANVTKAVGGTLHWFGSTGVGAGYFEVISNTNKIRIFKDVGGTPWPATTNFYLIGEVIVPV
jgi:hypothetical protein